MGSTLAALPCDILLDIMSHLSLQDLYNVTLVSSRLAGPAQRFLFQTIDLKLMTPTKPGHSVAKGNLHKFTNLVQTLFENSNLRSYVSKLSINILIHTWYVRFADQEALLNLLPNLKYLSLQPPPAHFQLSMLPRPALETLHLDFSGGRDHSPDTEPQNPLEIIERVFWAPQLRRLLIDGVSFTSEMGSLFSTNRYRSSWITDLEVRSCSQEHIGCLPDILSSIKALKRFTFEIHTPWETSHVYSQDIRPALLGQSVGLHAKTLVRLEIAASDAAEFPYTSLFGSLAEYSNLKILAIPDELLVVVGDATSDLVDALPPNLEELQLQFAMLRMQGKDTNRAVRIKRLIQLANVKKELFPALRRVAWWCQPCECWLNDGSRYGPVSDMDDLKTAFGKVGVTFEFISDPYFERTPLGGRDSGHPWWEDDDEEYAELKES